MSRRRVGGRGLAWCACVLVIVLVEGATMPAWAEPPAEGSAPAASADDGPPPEARRAFIDGKAAFERGDYETALQLFQRAALIAPAPSLYYNIGMAYERLARYEDSALAFEKYLELADPPATEQERGERENLRQRAIANRARAARANTAQPVPLVEPPLPPSGPVYPVYQRPAYTQPAYPAYVIPPMSHQQKLTNAQHHRNNGIALTTVGSVFLIGGVAAAAIGGVVEFGGTNVGSTSFSGERIGTMFAGVTLAVVGLPLFGTGVSATVRWQHTLSQELKQPDDGAAARKAALDLERPPIAPMAGAPSFVLSTPVVRF